MAAVKKETVKLNIISLEKAQAEYVQLCNEIKYLEAKRDLLKQMIVTTVMPMYKPDSILDLGMVTLSSRMSNEVVQMAAYKAFVSTKTRDILFPAALEFKAGKDKELGVKHGVIIQTAGDPVMTIKKIS